MVRSVHLVAKKMKSLSRFVLKSRVVLSVGAGPAQYFSSSGTDVTCVRHINPLRENRDNVVEDLSDKLRQKSPGQYSFLSKDLQFETEFESKNEVSFYGINLKRI